MGERASALSGTPATGQPRPRRSRKRHEGWTFVYLAVVRPAGSEAGGRFKIGVAIDPRERLKGVPEGTRIDWRASTKRALPTPHRAREVEAALHKALQPMRMKPGHRDSGYTEWFDIAAFATARLMLETLPDTMHESTWKPTLRPTQNPQAESSRRKRRHARTKPHDLQLCAANQQQLRLVRELWLRLARIVPMAVYLEHGLTPARLVLPGFRTGVLPPGHRLRMLAMGSHDIYRLHLPRGVEDVPCSLVTRVEYGWVDDGPAQGAMQHDGAGPQDLAIHLQATQALERLPDGPAIVTTLRAVLETVAAMVTAREQGWIEEYRPSPMLPLGDGRDVPKVVNP